MYYRRVLNKKTIIAGLAAGILGNILHGIGAYLLFDRFYLENPDLARDLGILVTFYYLALDLMIGMIIAYLSVCFRKAFKLVDWQAGIRAGFIIWIASSPVFIIKRQIMFKLSNWLLMEIGADLVIYIIMGAAAGFLAGRGIVEKETNK
jgi:hypothetical protein